VDEILEKIKAFATKAHGEQKRKFTGEQYINHPVRVMEICMAYTHDRPSLAAALLHDVLEDTEVKENEMEAFLKDVMPKEEAKKTLELVIWLTDVYVKEDYPSLNRRKRKNKEADRLSKSHPDAQTVKYADSIDNAIDITKNDTDFAGKFLDEVGYLLTRMDKGNKELYERAVQTIEDCKRELKKQKKARFEENGKQEARE
jgi:guanosine-3',5'-bis(diphosphate) 3'-pyrophosphohydrolase